MKMRDSKLIDWLKLKIRRGKTLVYFASGTYVNPDYKNLNYDNIILVDYAFRKNSFDGKSIFCLKLDNVDAVNLLKKLNLKIHCFVGLNEGLYEGGGRYPINSDCFLGYCFPLFADTLIHIGFKEYYVENKYSHLRKHFLDLPYLGNKLLNTKDESYISPSIFSLLGEKATVTLLTTKSKLKYIYKKGGIEVNVKHDSIWNSTDKLQALFVRYENIFQKQRIEKYENNIFPIAFEGGHTPSYKTYDVFEIVELCRENEFKKIGLVPNGYNYNNLIDKIEEISNGFPNEVFFFHLNKDDFKDLYKN